MASSAGQVPGASGSKMNFGFNVKYNKSGKSLQGSITIIVRNGGRVYQIKGNAMTSLAVKPSTCPKATASSPCTATFNGKANVRDITDPLNPISVDGNGSLQVTMTDKGDPGSADSRPHVTFARLSGKTSAISLRMVLSPPSGPRSGPPQVAGSGSAAVGAP